MTNFKQVVNNKKRGGNIKDGHHPARTKAQRRADDAQWLAAGFEYRWIRGAPRLVYTWGGNFPTFEVTPGIVGLNDEIEAIMFHDAEIDEQPLEGEDWIDIDGFMRGLWARS
jgi:hypothetical protein